MVIPYASVIAMIAFIALLSLALGSTIGMVYTNRSESQRNVSHEKESQLSAVVRTNATLPRTQSVASPTVEPIVESPSARPPTDDVPRAAAPPTSKSWDDLLHDTRETGDLSQAVVQVYELDADKYCDRLTSLEEQLGGGDASSDEDELQALVAKVTEINDAWMNEHGAADDRLNECRSERGKYKSEVEQLEDAMLNLASQIETTASNLVSLDIQDDITASRKRLLNEVRGLVACAHPLRDRSCDCLAAVMRDASSMSELEERHQRDKLTGTRNRWAIEAILHDWIQHSRVQTQRASVAVVDIDQFSSVNDQVGIHGGNQVLIRFSKLLDSLAQEHGAPVHVVRYAGAQFALFFEDTGARNAISCVERIRQTSEATTFDLDGSELKVTVTCGVTELGEEDTTNKIIARLRKTLHEAKDLGQNCSCIDEGSGPKPCEPPRYPSKRALCTSRADSDWRVVNKLKSACYGNLPHHS